MEHKKRFSGAHGSIDFGSAQRHQSGLAGETQRAERRLRQKRVDHGTHIGRHIDGLLEGARKHALGRSLVDM